MAKAALAIAVASCFLLSVEGLAVDRDSRGRIARSEQQRHAFKQHHPCPANGHRKGPCPGYVIDHVIPLCAGGADHPRNMQWQTVAAAKEKDREEVRQCRKGRK